MTDYDYPSDSHRAYTDSFRHTEGWVRNHQPGTFPFYSPSQAPSEVDSQADPPSDAESSHSIPPRLILDYGGGRMQRIPHPTDSAPHHGHGRTSSTHHSRSHSTRTTYQDLTNVPSHSHSHSSREYASRHSAEASRSRHGSYRAMDASREPEKIRILPSKDSSRNHHSHQHIRSRSLPREALAPIEFPNEPPVPLVPSRSGYLPQPAGVLAPPNSLAQSGSSISTTHQTWQRPGAASNHYTHSTMQNGGYPVGPATAIPTHHSPQVVYNHPPQVGPNGMIFSHSAPPLQQPGYVTLGPSQPDSRSGSKSKRSKSLTAGRSGGSTTLSYPSASSLHSKGSDATVYSAGKQKRHEIARAQTPVTATANPAYYSNQPHSSSFTKSLMKKIRGFADRLSTEPPESTIGHGRSHSRAASYYQPPSAIPVHALVSSSRGRDSVPRHHSIGPVHSKY
ncbi:hypothetical protein DL96DRAFT_1219307 [Flagelloscypha sp. PMI_526]|nr:hypothetical protein DL96DRAFT_1219307 [Flagelloscypha sp. PMI_526]